MHRQFQRPPFPSHAGEWNASDFEALQNEARSRCVRFTLFRRRFRQVRLLDGNGRSYRPDLLRTGLRLEQPAERKSIVFFLIAMLVRLGTELPVARETFQERQLLSAIQASHRPLIGSYGG